MNAVFFLATLGAAFQAMPPTEEVFRLFSGRVVEIEVQETGSAAKASVGTGFFVSPAGHLVTNYHVVADVVTAPERYRARLVRDGEEGVPVEVLNVDVTHDLALLGSELRPSSHFELAISEPAQGSRLYAMGHPLDLGLNIVEGTYNGHLKHSREPRIHFTGSLNPGMSGGPAISASGAVVGVNVATAGEQVSFLVPVKWAVRLLEATRAPGFEKAASLRDSVREQILAYQERSVAELVGTSGAKVDLGGVMLPTEPTSAFNCWADAYREAGVPYETVDHQCSTDDYIFVSDELVSGEIWFYHRLITSDELDRFQFSALYTADFQGTYHGMSGGESEVTPFRCDTGAVVANGLRFKTVFCLRGYRKLEGLYDLVFKAAVVGRPRLGLETALLASGVSYENAEALVRWYMGSISWNE